MEASVAPMVCPDSQLQPMHRIFAYLFAAFAWRISSGQRPKITASLLNDFTAIATCAPYVDAMFVDKECAFLLKMSCHSISPHYANIGISWTRVILSYINNRWDTQMSLDGSAEAPQSRNSAEADNEFVASARLIAGDNPPSWLIAHLARWAPSLRIDHHVHKRQPSRSAVVAELKATLGAIRTLKAATKNRALLEFLDLQEGASIFNASVLADELDDFEQRALFALSSSSLSGASGKTKAGAGKALHPNSSSPKSLCAAVILEAWVYFHKGKHPAASNTAIAAAANAYWEGSVGIPTGWGDSRLGSWRPYFKEASKAESAAIRNELRRHILTSAGPLS